MVLFWQYFSALSCRDGQAHTPPMEYCQQTTLMFARWRIQDTQTNTANALSDHSSIWKTDNGRVRRFIDPKDLKDPKDPGEQDR